MKIAEENGIALDPENWEQVWNLIDQYGEPDFLYAIVDLNSSLVKFGKSKNPGLRLKTLKIGNGSQLKIFAYCKHVSPMTEKEVHALLKAERVSGEWFKFSDKSRTVIEGMRAIANV